MFSTLSVAQLSDLLPYFSSHPKFILFANAIKFELNNTSPNHPCNFYLLETASTKYYFCFRQDHLPDRNGPILMIGSDVDECDESDVISGLQAIRQLEPSFDKMRVFLTTSCLSAGARNFLKTQCGLEELDFSHCHCFFIPPKAYSNFKCANLAPSLPPQYSLGSSRLSDVEIINSTWKYATAEDILQQEEKILRFPTSCVFFNDRPVAFEMIGLHGQLNHQYTLPEHRNKGLGTIVENSLIAKCIDAGFTPIKSVELANEQVLKRSMEHPEFEAVRDADGEIVVFDYSVFEHF